jgi:membrane-bound serine protease (ClpP class)
MDASFLTLGLVLIGVGFVLLVGELCLCTSGILLVLSGASITGGVVLVFLHDTTAGLATLVGVFVALPAVGILFARVWPHTPLGKRLLLTASPEDATVAAMPFNQELEQLKGRIGRTLSALRPAGVVDFDGRRIDTVTEGMMVDPGQLVRCIDVRAGRVVVRPVEKPNLGDLETAVFT